MIYIASPFSSPFKIVEKERFFRVSRYAQHLLSTGYICFSPVVYGYHFHNTYGVPGDFATWVEFNKAMLRAASLLDIYMLPGWKVSVGVSAELEYAEQLKIPVRYTEPLQW